MSVPVPQDKKIKTMSIGLNDDLLSRISKLGDRSIAFHVRQLIEEGLQRRGL